MLSRRNFLQSSLLCALSLSPLSLQAAKAAHVVIVGAGWGGLSAAKTLRSLNRECQITVIEKQDKFISCPMSNWVVGQIKDMDQITFSYKDGSYSLVVPMMSKVMCSPTFVIKIIHFYNFLLFPKFFSFLIMKDFLALPSLKQ